MLTEELHVRLTELFQSPFSYQLQYFTLISVKIILKDFHHRKFFSRNSSSKSPPNPLKQRKSAKHDKSFLLMFPQILPYNLTLFSNHHPTQPLTICNDYLPSAHIRYFTKYFKKYFHQTKAQVQIKERIELWTEKYVKS